MIEPNSNSANSSESSIELQIGARKRDLMGIGIWRVLPYARRRMVGPWIFFDHIGPIDFGPGEGMEILPHPHINLATVTYLFEGQIMHRDSLGVVQTIEPGAINLMVAGKGLAHSERSVPALREKGFRLHALQLWLALPEEAEEIDPAFYHYGREELPELQTGKTRLRVMIGEAFGLVSPVKTFSPALYAEASLSPQTNLRLPENLQELAVYVVSGAININNELVTEHTMAVCKPGSQVENNSEMPAQLAIIGGDPVGPRYIWWNFVSSRQERIEQAKQDWQQDRFAKIPGETEFVPLPAF
ncbi:MAG TPA: pirin family protein [Chloroflexia bacterium]|nr:pirin family protein [Chloroflexia bacterium]